MATLSLGLMFVQMKTTAAGFRCKISANSAMRDSREQSRQSKTKLPILIFLNKTSWSSIYLTVLLSSSAKNSKLSLPIKQCASVTLTFKTLLFTATPYITVSDAKWATPG